MRLPEVAIAEIRSILDDTDMAIVAIARSQISRLLNWIDHAGALLDDPLPDLDYAIDVGFETSQHSMQTAHRPTVAVHIGTLGEVDVLKVAGDEVDVLMIDERATNDRVYRLSGRRSRFDLWTLIGRSEIGSSQDDRHQALAASILAERDGQRRLRLVEP